MRMKLIVELCENWNGKDKVCDINRCREYIERTGGKDNPESCYHRPYTIHGRRKTVIEALEILHPKVYKHFVESRITQ